MDTPTIYDVSRLSGVSTATVSRTFTTPDRVRESTRRRVYAAAEALSFSASVTYQSGSLSISVSSYLSSSASRGI